MIHFRLADRYDIENLRHIFNEDAITYHPESIRQFLAESTCQLYLALNDYDIIGFATCFLQLRPDGEVSQWIERFFVSRPNRQADVGFQMLKYIIQDARKIGCRKTVLQTDLRNGAAKKLFAKFEGELSDTMTFEISHR